MLVLSVAVALAATTTVNASDRVLARNRIANSIKRNLIKVDEYASTAGKTTALEEIVQLDDTDFYRQLGIGSMSMPSSNNIPSSGGDSEDGGSSSSSGGGSSSDSSSSSGGGDGSSSDSNTGSDSSSDNSDPTSSTDTGTDGTGTDAGTDGAGTDTGSGDTGVEAPVEAPTAFEQAGAGVATPVETAPSESPPVGSGGIPASTPLESPTADEDATFVPTNTTDSSGRRNRAMGAATAITIAVTVVPFL